MQRKELVDGIEKKIEEIGFQSPTEPDVYKVHKKLFAQKIAQSLTVDEGEIKDITTLKLQEKVEQQFKRQVKEVDAKGLWCADLNSWSFEEMIGFLCKAIAQANVIKVKEGKEIGGWDI